VRVFDVDVELMLQFQGSGIAIMLCFSDQSGDGIDIVKLGIDGERGRGSLKACISILLSDDMNPIPLLQNFRWLSVQLQILKSLKIVELTGCWSWQLNRVEKSHMPL
jgi:hypothetical protein